VLRFALSSFLLLVFAGSATAIEGTLSENIRIESARLNYALQYRVYTPPGYERSHNKASNLPTLYITDGQGYIENGKMDRVLDAQIRKGAIEPIIAIFVDSRNPDNLAENRRNYQFFCVKEYAEFYRKELVPVISRNYRVSTSREDRVILGLSFGALNSACFGIMAHDVFEGIAMHSPAMHPVPSLLRAYNEEPRRPIKIFFSIGSRRDNTAAGRKFRKALAAKDYEMFYKEVPFGHSWKNWRPLQDDVLRYFFGK